MEELGELFNSLNLQPGTYSMSDLVANFDSVKLDDDDNNDNDNDDNDDNDNNNKNKIIILIIIQYHKYHTISAFEIVPEMCG